MTALINYLEIPCTDIRATKTFYQQVFGWSFIDYGDAYCVVKGAGINAGFYLSHKVMQVANGSALLVIQYDDLTRAHQQILAAGGKITVEPFDFPGGQRFHFLDVNGNELSVWSPTVNT